MSTRCYGIDGSPYASFDRYIPCNATAAATGGHTSCCAPGDNCLTNGLCQGPNDEKRKANLFWRNGCTDPTWKNAACPKHCEGLDKPDTHGIFYCLQSNSWCCPTGAFDGAQIINTTCCSKSDLVFSAADPIVYTVAQINIVSTLVPSARIAGTSAVTSQGASASSLTTTTTMGQPILTSQASAASSSTSSSTGDSKMGIYVGVPLGVLLAVALAAIAFLLVTNRRLKRAQQGQPYPIAGGFAQNEKAADYAHATELGTRPGELSDGSDVAVELPHGSK